MLQDSLVLSSLPLLSSLLRKRVRRELAEEREEVEARREEEELREEGMLEEEAKPELREEEEECLLSLQWGWMPAWDSSSLGQHW